MSKYAPREHRLADSKAKTVSKPKTSQRQPITTDIYPKNSGSITLILGLQKTIGNFAVQRMLTQSAPKNVIQRTKLLTMGGEWEDVTNKKHETENTLGLDMRLEFSPNASVNAPKIGLTQAIKSQVNGESHPIGRPKQQALQKHRTVTEEGSKGWLIDRLGDPNRSVVDPENPTNLEPNNPIYGSDRMKEQKGSNPIEATTFKKQQPGYSQLGQRVPNAPPVKAVLTDTPQLDKKDVGPNSTQKFETTALALDGPQQGTYYGSVKWGWETDNLGEHHSLPLELATLGKPSPNFLKSAEKWNASGSGAAEVPNFMQDFHVKVGEQKFRVWTGNDSKNVPLPIPDDNTDDMMLDLPNMATYKQMKKLATQLITIKSGMLPTKKYGQYVEECQMLKAQKKWVELRDKLQELENHLLKMENAGLNYWNKDLTLKEKYFRPIYNAVRIQHQMAAAKANNG